jgi:quercetin dioxygenase-like cupin family protein
LSPIEAEAEIRVSSKDVRDDLVFFTKTLGFRLDKIFPADDPSVVVVSGYGVRLCIDRNASEAPGTLRLHVPDPQGFADGELLLVAPNGMHIELVQFEPPLLIPSTDHAFVVRHLRDKAPWVVGRAGMNYRDLIPDRLGGSIIASHIRIPSGGIIPDMVHYHRVGFQLIYCYKGWVDILYEDQGPTLRLSAGDCVTQPPEIRHRVLLASSDIEVVEIGVPAEHVTTIDHDMELPNGTINPDREFSGQTFVHHRVEQATWHPWRIPGFIHRDTGVGRGTQGVAGVRVAKFEQGSSPITSHTSDILFSFVMDGTMTLEGEGQIAHELQPGDAFVVPPDMRTRYTNCSPDLELLEVSLPGNFGTEEHERWEGAKL